MKSSQALLYFQSYTENTYSYHPPNQTVSQGNLQTSDKKVPLSALYNCHLENLEPWSKGQLTHRAIQVDPRAEGCRGDLANSD